MSGVERHTFTITPHSSPQREFGGPCLKCGLTMFRTYYSDAEIEGKRMSIVLDTCGCKGNG